MIDPAANCISRRGVGAYRSARADYRPDVNRIVIAVNQEDSKEDLEAGADALDRLRARACKAVIAVGTPGAVRHHRRRGRHGCHRCHRWRRARGDDGLGPTPRARDWRNARRVELRRPRGR